MNENLLTRKASLVLLAGAGLQMSTLAGNEEEFYKQRETEPTFEEVMESGNLPRGHNSGKGFKGAEVEVNHDLLKDGPNSHRPLIQDIMIHTLGNSLIRRRNFEKWSRWYQEDGNTQIFRLFKDEENVRNSRKLAARIEAFSEFKWEKGDGWQEWVATYTIIKPVNCAIFQAKNPINDWSIMINMNKNGDVTLNHRRGTDKMLAKNLIGKPFHLRIRENGHDYEVYFNGKKEGEGSYDRPEGMTNFRWGMYMGAKEVTNDAMILVTGAAVNPRDSDKVAEESTENEEALPAKPVELPEPEGLPIASRSWLNREGDTIIAEARYLAGSATIHFKIDGSWITYPIKNLSEIDQKKLQIAQEIISE